MSSLMALGFDVAFHVAAGFVALLSGAIAVATKKGAPLHTGAGKLFSISMLLLGASGFVSAILKPSLDIPLTASGVITSYFVATSWMAARRRDGRTGLFEAIMCAIALSLGAGFAACGIAALVAVDGLFRGFGALLFFVFAAICLYAGYLDLGVVRSRRMSSKQRIERHLWRMSFAFVTLTSFLFLGQQDFLPSAVRGSPFIIIPALSPAAVLLFWLLRFRYPRRKAGRAFEHSTDL